MEDNTLQPAWMPRLVTPASGVAVAIAALVVIFINDSLRPYTPSAGAEVTSELDSGAYVVHGGRTFPIAEATHMSLEPGDHFLFVSADPEDAYRDYSLDYSWPAELIPGSAFQRPKYLKHDSYPCDVTFRGMNAIVITPREDLMPGFYRLNGIYPVVFSVEKVPGAWKELVKRFESLQEEEAANELSGSIAALTQHIEDFPVESRPIIFAGLLDAMN